jgi:formate/nitrite transporter FocA (FNT family)
MSENKQRDEEEQDIIRRTSPSGRVVYKAVLNEGNDELKRSSSALFWSGLAAGLSMGFSLVAQGLLHAYLPDANWRPLVENFGYSLGFIIVILGRQQLFTENTLTPVLPLLLQPSWKTFWNMLRLWAVVLIANLAGAILVSLALGKTNAFNPGVRDAFYSIGRDAMSHDVFTVWWRGVFAGWLIALMVWLLPFAEVARLWVILILAYIVGLGSLTHIVAGSIDTFTLAAAGLAPWSTVFLDYTLPTLAGNIVGGVALVAVINHAQVVSGAGEDI